MTEPRPTVPFVLLDDGRAPDGRCFLLTDPDQVLVCERPEDVPATLDAIGKAGERGLFAAGFMSYELGYVLESRLRPLLPEKRNVPLIWMGLFRHCRQIDPAESLRLIDDWGGDYGLGDMRPSIDRDTYIKAIGRIRDAIAAGEVYQVNYTFKYHFRFSGDPLGLYGSLRRKQKAAYGAIVATPDFHVISLSPELFVEVEQGRARSLPMKGTVARGPTLEADAGYRKWLRTDEKSRAENLMIVDLIRNDLCRIAEIGSVRVPRLFAIETFPTLHQMISEVTARPRPGIGFADVVHAIFPCGSITGAPKVRTMEVIRQLEGEARGVYTGGIGMISPDGDMRFNVGIRTPVLHATGDGEMGVGGGILYDSDPQAEYEEALLKGHFLTAPYEPFQLIETLRLEGGRYHLLDRHLARLTASATYFVFACDIDAVGRRLADLATGLGTGTFRVRLLLDVDGQIDVTAEPFVTTDTEFTFTISRRPVDRRSPFTYHKTTRRGFLDQERTRGGCGEVIFLNDLGQITEGSFTNIFVERGGRLLTPPLECGLLAGTLRQELLESGRAVEAPLEPADLESADAVFLGNSVRGLVPARREGSG